MQLRTDVYNINMLKVLHYLLLYIRRSIVFDHRKMLCRICKNDIFYSNVLAHLNK